MSYILDALKRAESERSRGEIPGLHAQPLGLTPGTAGPAANGSVILAALAAGVVVLGLAWWWLSDDAPAPPVSAVPQLAPVAAVPAPAAPVPAAITPAPALNPTPPALTVEVVPPVVAAAPSAARAAQKPLAKPLPKPAANTAPRRQAAPTASAPFVGGGAARPAADTESRILALSELPIDVRGALPPLVVGGASHSEHAASRMLILNGQLYHEGDRLTAELTLQQIQLRSAVLSFRGYRFSISY
jgi:general secretion pathway protein B